MDPLVAAALSLILLHRADGGEVAVIPAHITSLHARAPPTDAKNKLVPLAARCVVWMDDGKMISVLETCDAIKQLLAR